MRLDATFDHRDGDAALGQKQRGRHAARPAAGDQYAIVHSVISSKLFEGSTAAINPIFDAAPSQGIPISDRINRQYRLSERSFGLSAYADSGKVSAHLNEGIDVIAIQSM